ncbi:MAG: hypothetical protein GF308_03085 [Candidatus Heimdallarchaeota archaeon]|nr:hypothetical protein [Candidatus Heimdallarchaeota archaeon]
MTKEIIAGERKSYLHSFWTIPNGKQRLKIVVKYYIEEFLQMSIKEFVKTKMKSCQKKLPIRSAISMYYESSLLNLLNDLYPQQITLLEWLEEINSLTKAQVNCLTNLELEEITKAKLMGRIDGFPRRLFATDKAKEHLKIIVKYIIENYLQIPVEKVPKALAQESQDSKSPLKVFFEGASRLFASNRFEAIEYIYPGVFQPEQFPLWTNKKQRDQHSKKIIPSLTEEEAKILIIKKING